MVIALQERTQETAQGSISKHGVTADIIVKTPDELRDTWSLCEWEKTKQSKTTNHKQPISNAETLGSIFKKCSLTKYNQKTDMLKDYTDNSNPIFIIILLK